MGKEIKTKNNLRRATISLIIISRGTKSITCDRLIASGSITIKAIKEEW